MTIFAKLADNDLCGCSGVVDLGCDLLPKNWYTKKDGAQPDTFS